MKFVSYLHAGHKSFGFLNEDGIVDLKRRFSRDCDDLRAFLSTPAFHDRGRLAGLRVDIDPSEVEYLPVIDRPDKIICVGMNYADKRIEFAEQSPAPTLFIRFPYSQTGHDCPLVKPRETSQFDYEGELAVVIGRAGHKIRAEDAYDHIAGYSCYMDASVRDWQHSWFTAGKNWERTGGFGPWLVTADEIPDPHDLVIETRLNGERVQSESTGKMIRRIPELVEYISTFSPLVPGDVIITGSPGGVGMKRVPQLFLQDGDLVEVEISRIGRLANRVEDDRSVALRCA